MLISSWRRLIPIWLLIAFSLCTSCGLFDILEGDQDKAAEIAAQLGVEPSWNKIREYLYERAFSLGMSKEDVYVILARVGPYESWESSFWDPELGQQVHAVTIRFTETGIHIMKWFVFIFDSQGKLARIHIDSP